MTAWQNKVVLVTGGSSGLGLSIGREFAKAGARVILAARNREKLDLAAVQIRSQIANIPDESRGEGDAIEQRRVVAIPTDVTQQDQVDAMFRQTLDRFGRLDALVNCAGQSTRGEIATTSVAQFQKFWEINFLSAVRCTLGALPHLLQQKGHLVQIGSLASKRAIRYIGAYAVSKFPLDAYSQQLRLELGPQGLHVLLVCPGPIKRSDAGNRYDIIVSNPPYVGRAEMRRLPREYRHEPVLGLASGRDGLDSVRVILGSTRRHLNDHGILVVEVGNSERAVLAAWPKLPFLWPSIAMGGGGVFILRAEDLGMRGT